MDAEHSNITGRNVCDEAKENSKHLFSDNSQLSL